MDALPFIKEMLYKPALRVFLSDNDPVHVDDSWHLARQILDEMYEMRMRNLRVDTEDENRALIEFLRLKARQVGIISRDTQKRIPWYSLLNAWRDSVKFFIDKMVSCNYWKQTEIEGEFEHKIDIDAVINSLDDIQRIEDLLPDRADSSNFLTNEEKSRAFLLMTAFPALRELKEPSKILEFLLELSKELDNLPQLICEASEGQPLALLLIGSLLSLKPREYYTWKEVKDVLVKIKESGEPAFGLVTKAMPSVWEVAGSKPGWGNPLWILKKLGGLTSNLYSKKIKDSDNGAPNNLTWHILTYCFHDLPFSLQLCFLYLACYPIDYEIPARSLTEIWIAENLVTPKNGETREETANKYLEQLVKRYSPYIFRKIDVPSYNL